MTKKLLLVEDHAPDVLVVRRALRSVVTTHDLTVVDDGDQVLPYLRGEGSYQDRSLPDLIILDLNMPRVSGYVVLQSVKAEARYRHIPIIVLSGSEAPKDVNYCYACGAAAYLIKPGSIATASELLEAVETIWLKLGRTPT